MKKMGDMLLQENPFSEIVMGNTALVRAMVEAGTRVVTSYPGSPTPEIATAIRSIPPAARPFYFEFSTNEKVATEVAFGAAMNGHLSTVFFKSVGLNVASDSFVQLSLMKITGGMVIVLGDDPGANSSQNEQDNRHFAHMSYTPVFEPANPSEVYSFYREAARISRQRQMPIIVRLTTHVCHAKERVEFGGWKPKPHDPAIRFNAADGPFIPITSMVFPKKRRALENLSAIERIAGDSGLNRLVDNQNQNYGIITAGLPFLSLLEVLENAAEQPDILKLAVVYPVSRKRVTQFLQAHDKVLVLEELDNILEKEIKLIAFEEKIGTGIIGKKDAEDWIGEYTPDKVFQVIKKNWPELLPDKPEKQDRISEAPPRPAQMCPGCGHRAAFHAIAKAVSEQDIKVADIGCHTLGFLPPYKMGDILLCMGASTGIGSGMSLFNSTGKVIAFLGDSTFFHAGLPGIINALFNKHQLTLIIMENGTTAMTGHQSHAASGENFNEPVDAIPVRKVLEGFGIEQIHETDTYQMKKLTELVKKAMAEPGLSVVIAKHPCMLKQMREKRRRPGFKSVPVTILQDDCTRRYECVEKFGCPSFVRNKDGRITINHDLCIGDGSCVRVCPSQAINLPKGDRK
ncbi:MAG: indolepyruvate ferredoxin oxidoreductase subunit alpha [Desulfobacteraceae bacterium]|nr:MAG: indolepyruvate ferredoxin oxidoreductase subunit alpha [Desulfobacteraceae bacterium]